MDQELIKEINKTLYYINEFNNGNDEYVDAVEEVLNGVFLNVKSSNRFYLTFRMLIALVEFRCTILEKLTRTNIDMDNLIKYCKEDIKYYKDSMKKLKKYCKYVDKTGDANNLDDAYILTLKLSDILTKISEYFAEINNLEANMLRYPNYECRSSNVNRFEMYTNKNQIDEIIKKLER